MIKIKANITRRTGLISILLMGIVSLNLISGLFAKIPFNAYTFRLNTYTVRNRFGTKL